MVKLRQAPLHRKPSKTKKALLTVASSISCCVLCVLSLTFGLISASKKICVRCFCDCFVNYVVRASVIMICCCCCVGVSIP